MIAKLAVRGIPDSTGRSFPEIRVTKKGRNNQGHIISARWCRSGWLMLVNALRMTNQRLVLSEVKRLAKQRCLE